MQHTISCPSCGTKHTFDGGLSFREECSRCAADLHVCLTCRFYDRYVENECRETEAEYVKAKDRRNLCEYWKPRENAEEGMSEADAARAKLAALFGDKPASSSAAGGVSSSPADEAKRKLEELFKKK